MGCVKDVAESDPEPSAAWGPELRAHITPRAGDGDIGAVGTANALLVIDRVQQGPRERIAEGVSGLTGNGRISTVNDKRAEQQNRNQDP